MRSLREEWRMLRGLPDQETPTIGDEPCIEISDLAKLCKNPLVSIVALVWSHEKWLDESIASMVMQKTDFEYEILLCEDHSPDGSLSICKKWQAQYPEKIRIVSGKRNLGVWKNGSLGKREARGVYLALLEGDDFWTDGFKLQKQIELARKGDYRFVVAWNDVLNDRDKRLSSPVFRPTHEISLETYQGGYYHTSTYLISRELNDRIQKYCHKILPYDTVAILLALGLGEKIGVLTEVVSVYRQTGTGIYTGNTGAHNAEIAISMFTALLRHGPKPLRSFCRYSYACALLDYFIHATRNCGFAWLNLLSLSLAIVNLTFKINPRHTFFLWGSAIKSFWVRTRCGAGK